MNLFDRINQQQQRNQEMQSQVVTPEILTNVQQNSMPQFQIDLTPTEQAIVTERMSMALNPDEEKERWQQAILMSRQYDVPLEYAIDNLETIVKYQTGVKPQFNQTFTRALKNSIDIGSLTVDRGRLAENYYWAERNGEDTSEIERQIEELDGQIAEMYDSTPRKWYQEILKGAAQTLSYTADIAMVGAGFGAIGNMVAPGLGTALATAGSFSEGFRLTKYSSYYDMVKEGVNPTVANWTSTLSGGIQAAIESALGIEAGLGRIAGGGSANFVTRLMKNMYLNGTFNTIGLVATKYLTNVASEGIEEFLQEITDKVFTNIAYTQSGMDAPYSVSDTMRSAVESFVQGAGAALVLGVTGTIAETVQDINYAKAMRSDALRTDSKQVFIERHMEDEQLEGIGAQRRREALSQTYDNINAQYEEAIEGLSTAEARTVDVDTIEQPENVGMEDEDGNIVEAQTSAELPELKRLSNGRLRVQESTNVVQMADGDERHQLLVGSDDGTSNRYGTVTYTLKQDGSIEINSVKTRAGYQGITQDMVQELARRNPGVEITWDPETETQQAVRQNLLDNSPTGKLNWYEPMTDRQEQVELADKIGKAFTNLNRQERDVAAVLMQLRASAKGMTANEYMDSYISEMNEAELGKGKLGRTVIRGAKAVIEAGKSANFSTFAHETFHVIRNEMSDEENTRLANAFKEAVGTDSFKKFVAASRKVLQMDYNTIRSQIEAMDGKTWNEAQEEIAARMFESYLLNGKTSNSKLADLFSKIAEFFRKIYGVLRGQKMLNDNIVKAYDSLFERSAEAQASISDRRQEQNDKGEVILFQNEISNSTLERLTSFADGQNAIIKSKELGDVEYEIGVPGKHGHGLLHIIEKRMREGNSLEDAVDVAIAVAESVATGDITNSIQNTRHLDKGKIRAIVALKDNGNIVITGYEIRNEDETSDAYRRSEDYASEPHVRSEQMVASFNERVNQLLGKSKSYDQTEFNQSEYDEVVAQYKNTDQWMKAPNGNPTNLTERQWVQVRTPSFKKWFGDWENDPENASKLVDKNGEPLAVYHGTREPFEAFDMDYAHNGGNYGKGIYTGHIGVASIFGRIRMPLFMNIRNPFVDYFAGNDTVLKEYELSDIEPLATLLKDGGYISDRAYEELISGRTDGTLMKLAWQQNSFWNGEISYANRRNVINDLLRQLGYDGIIGDMWEYGADQFIAFNPNQVKSATNNVGTFDADNPSVLYQTEDGTEIRQNGRTLVVTHNLTEDNIKNILKIGGMPMPSLAVTRPNIKIDSFGPITLVGNRQLAERLMRNGEIFDRDMWSPTAPRPEYKVNKKALQKFDKWLISLPDRNAFGVVTTNALYDRQKNTPEELASHYSYNDAIRLEYLKEKGIDFEIPTRQHRYTYDNRIMQAAKEWAEKTDTKYLGYEQRDEFFNAIKPFAEEAIKEEEAKFKAKTNAGLSVFRTNVARAYLDFLEENLSPDNFSSLSSLLLEARGFEEGKTETDTSALRDKLNEVAPADDVARWLIDTKFDGIFSEPVITVGRSKVPYNAQNIFEFMRRSQYVGNELGTITYSNSLAASRGARPLMSRQDIAEKENLLGDVKDENYEEAFESYHQIAIKNYKYNDTWDALDDSNKAIANYLASDTRTTANLKQQLRKLDFNVTDELVSEAQRLVDYIEGMTRRYFEAKPRRIMQLSDFQYAIVPSDTRAETIKTLADAGLLIVQSDSREEALKGISGDENVLFQTEDEDEMLLSDARDMGRAEFIEYGSWMYEEYSEAELNEIWNRAHGKSGDGARQEGPAITADMTDDQKDEEFIRYFESDEALRAMIDRLRSAYSLRRDVGNHGIGATSEAEYEAIVRDLERFDRFMREASPFFKNIVSGNGEISETSLKNIRTTMENAPRMYRDLYAELTGDDNLRATVYDAYLPNIDEPGFEELRGMSIADRRRLSEQIENKTLKAKLLSGEETLDGEAEKVIRSMDDEIAKLEEDLRQMQAKNNEYYNAFNADEKRIVQLNEQMADARQELDDYNRKIRLKMDKNSRISPKAITERNTIQEKIDLLNEQIKKLRATDRTKAAEQRRQAIADLKQEIREKQRERREAKRIHDYKLRLASAITREVSNAVDYEYRQRIMAIQALVDPNFRQNTIWYEGKRYTVPEFRDYFRSMFEGVSDEELNEEIRNDYEAFGLTRKQAERLLQKNLNDFTVAELEQMAQQVADLADEGRQVWQAKQDEKRRQARRLQNQIISGIMARPHAKTPDDMPTPGSAEDKKAQKNVRKQLRTAWFKTLNMDRKAQMLDNDEKGTAYDLLIRQRREVQDIESKAKSARINPVMDLMRQLNVKPQDLYETVDITMNGVTEKFTYSDLFYGLAAQREEDNFRAFAYGTLVTIGEKERLHGDNDLIETYGQAKNRQFVQQAEAALAQKPDFVKVFQAMENDLQSHSTAMAEFSIREYNTVPNFMDYYLPIYRADFNGTKLAAQMSEDIRKQNPGKNAALPSMGRWKERIDISANNQRPVHMDYFSTWLETVEEVEHTIATLGYERDLKRVFQNFGSETLKSYIDANFGRGMLKDIDNYINEVGNPPVYNDVQGTEKTIRSLRGNLYSAYLGFKASGIVLQAITSPAPTLGYVNPFNLARNLLRMTFQYRKTWDFVSGMSEFMKNRSMDPALDIVKREANTYTDPKLKRAYANFLEKGTMGLEVIDKWAVTASWMSLYEKKLNEFEFQTDPESMRQAARYADEIIAETQPLADPLELAPLFKSRSEWAKAFMQFTTSMNVIWNNVTYDIIAQSRKKGTFKRNVGMIFGYALAGAILGAVRNGTGDDDEPEENVRRFMYEMTTQFTGSVPVFGTALDQLAEGVITGKASQFYGSNSIFPGIEDTLKGLTKLGESFSEEDEEKRKQKLETALRNMTKGVGLLAGVPTSALSELKRTFLDEEGFTFNPAALAGRRD